MKKIASFLILAAMILSCIPFAFSANAAYIPEKVGKNVLSHAELSAFENSYDGYKTQLTTYEDKLVREISRTGSDKTSIEFCLYRWGAMQDIDGNNVPLDTANYIAIEYYYDSPDSKPALEGTRMYWMQGRVIPEENMSDIVEFGWGHKIYSTEIIANEWDTLIFPLCENSNFVTQRKHLTTLGKHYLHQIKLFPLEKDMGKDDTLYIGSITIQSWDPREGDAPSAERKVAFYGSESDMAQEKEPVTTITAKDLDFITIPEFSGNLPENRQFVCWINAYDGREYKAGAEMKMTAGADLSFYPLFVYAFDKKENGTAYVNGYPDGTFRPSNKVTRAEAAKIVASFVELGENDKVQTSFTDVKEGDWYYDAVITLESVDALGIYKEKFMPDFPITRGELVQILYAISPRNGQSKKYVAFSDVSEKNPAFDAIMSAASEGIITGYEDNTFRANESITRAETVTVINRFIGRVYNDNAMTSDTFSDVEGHWAKGQIVASATTLADNTYSFEQKNEKYVLSGKSASDYIMGLHSQAKSLSGDAVREGIDIISEQMKKDVLSTGNTEDYYGDKMTGVKWYVSEKNGDDKNDGRTPETAVKTIAGLNAKIRFDAPGTSVLFERGGVYRGQVMMKKGFIYGSYGEGEKPVVTTAVKDYADPELWEETDVENIYKLKESIYNVGIIAFDHGMFDHGNYDALYGKNRIFGSNIGSYDELMEDLEFFSCNRILYLKSDKGNPGERFKSIEIGTRIDIFDGAGNDVIIDNIAMKYTGSHAVGSSTCKNLTVTNCEFSWLGGSLLGEYAQTTTQYGNAVEIYGSCDGYYVRNNWMYQIYDTAITHQGKDFEMYNIEYTENLMEYCHWGIECWASAVSGKPKMSNYVSRYNVLRNGGYGWGSIVTNRQNSARLYSFSTVDGDASDMRCEYTIIDRCSGYLLDIDEHSPEQFYSNIYVQDEKHILGGLRDRQCNATKAGAVHILEHLGDTDLVYIFIPEN